MSSNTIDPLAFEDSLRKAIQELNTAYSEHYSNDVRITSNSQDVSIVFSQHTSKGLTPRVEVTLPPGSIMDLFIGLYDTITLYENIYGPVAQRYKIKDEEK